MISFSRFIPSFSSRSRGIQHRRGVSLIESAIVLSGTLLIFLAGLDMTVYLIRQSVLSEGARRAARIFAVRGSNADRMEIQGPETLDVTVDNAHEVCDQLRPYLSTMPPAEVRLTAEWLDGNNQLDQRVKVTLRFKHQPLLTSMKDYLETELSGSSTVRISH